MTDLDTVNADLQDLKTKVPTLEEQIFTAAHVGWPTTSNTVTNKVTWEHQGTLLIAEFPMKILSLSTVAEWWDCAASDTDYWQATVLALSPASWSTLAIRSTQITGANANGGVTRRVAWDFKAAPWADIVLNAGDLLAILWTPVGSPGPKILPATYSGRYRRV